MMRIYGPWCTACRIDGGELDGEIKMFMLCQSQPCWNVGRLVEMAYTLPSGDVAVGLFEAGSLSV